LTHMLIAITVFMLGNTINQFGLRGEVLCNHWKIFRKE